MIQFILSLFNGKSELERYTVLVERANRYYSTNRKAILSQCRVDAGGGLPARKPLKLFNEDSSPYLFLGKGSKMEN